MHRSDDEIEHSLLLWQSYRRVDGILADVVAYPDALIHRPNLMEQFVAMKWGHAWPAEQLR